MFLSYMSYNQIFRTAINYFWNLFSSEKNSNSENLKGLGTKVLQVCCLYNFTINVLPIFS